MSHKDEIREEYEKKFCIPYDKEYLMGGDAVEIFDWFIAKIDSLMEEKRKEIEGLRNKWKDGTIETIGAMLMGDTQETMKNGFEEYKKLKIIAEDRDMVHQQAIDSILKILE